MWMIDISTTPAATIRNLNQIGCSTAAATKIEATKGTTASIAIHGTPIFLLHDRQDAGTAGPRQNFRAKEIPGPPQWGARIRSHDRVILHL
jgi:hypothetical protein